METEISPKIIKPPGAEDHILRLPEEIIEEILSRLPVKSLLKFRCVSKCWRDLIGSNRFIKAHLENSTKNPNFSHHRIILIPSISSGDRLKHCSLPSLLNNPTYDSIAFDNYSIDFRLKSILLVGCCNGLVCILLDRKEFILWNPSIRMSKKLPDVDSKMNGMAFTKYGFGYDESKDDYKVFAVLSSFCPSTEFRIRSFVYSLKANSWKIRQDRDTSPFEDEGKFVSGSLHWKDGYGYKWDIVSFDLKSEVYGVVEKPSYSKEGCVQAYLGVLGGCLCLVYDGGRTGTDVWVMKEYGLKESWMKVVTFSNLESPFYIFPLCVFPNGEILIVCGKSFLRYSPKDHVFRYEKMVDMDPLCEMDVYIESLVSLVSDEEQEVTPDYDRYAKSIANSPILPP